MIVLAFVLGLNNATLTIFAQLRGAGDSDGIGRYLGAFAILLLVLSALIGSAGHVLAGQLLALLNTPPEIFDAALIYLQVNFIGTAFLSGCNFIGTVLRGFGDSRTLLCFVLLARCTTAGQHHPAAGDCPGRGGERDGGAEHRRRPLAARGPDRPGRRGLQCRDHGGAGDHPADRRRGAGADVRR